VSAVTDYADSLTPKAFDERKRRTAEAKRALRIDLRDIAESCGEIEQAILELFVDLGPDGEQGSFLALRRITVAVECIRAFADDVDDEEKVDRIIEDAKRVQREAEALIENADEPSIGDQREAEGVVGLARCMQQKRHGGTT
jgi:hypothetical protein